MKKQLTQKYLALIIVAISFIYLISCQKETSRITSAKIIYTDIIPDTIIAAPNATSEYILDLDNNGVNDFTFECFYNRTECRFNGTYGFKTYLKVKPVDNSFNEVLNISVDPAVSYTYPTALDTLNEIGTTSHDWSSASSQFLKYIDACPFGAGGYINEYGNWPDNNDKYLGLKLINGNQAFYGWVRINVHLNIGIEMMIKDYAYNSAPNELIHAGQKQ